MPFYVTLFNGKTYGRAKLLVNEKRKKLTVSIENRNTKVGSSVKCNGAKCNLPMKVILKRAKKIFNSPTVLF